MINFIERCFYILCIIFNELTTKFISGYLSLLSWGRAPLWHLTFAFDAFSVFAQEDDKDVTDKNNRYFGCFYLAIPTRTIFYKTQET